MKLGLRGKLLLASLVVITVSVLTGDVWLRSTVVDDLIGRIEADLAVRAALAAELASRERADFDQLADTLGVVADARVTFIGVDGTVLGDSSRDDAALADMGRHEDRPEVALALQTGEGRSLRRSPTLDDQMLYVARTFERNGQLAGVARVALPLDEVDDASGRLRRLLFAGTLLALVVAIVLSSAGAHWASRHARDLSNAARRMADGDLSTRTNADGTDEFSELGRALDRLAANLSSTLGELRAERDLLGGVLAGMGEGVLLTDESGRVAMVNPALREMLLIGDDATGRDVSLVVEDPDLKALVEKALATRTHETGEIEIEGLKPRRLLVRALSLSTEPAGVLVVFVDVTDLRRLEKLRRDFVANVSHELRTPVTAIRSATETLHDAAVKDPKAVPIFVDIIERNAERLQHLVEDLLDLSRLESREYRLELAPLDPAEVLPQALALFRERAAKKGVSLSVDASSSPRVLADARALEQVLSNLLENAIKYCPSGARVRLAAVSEQDHVRIEVRDTGPGIEPKHLARLFERFYRVDKGRSRDIGGTGLGLAIVKHLVEAMGGSVGVDSVPRRGSTFWFTLPQAS